MWQYSAEGARRRPIAYQIRSEKPRTTVSAPERPRLPPGRRKSGLGRPLEPRLVQKPLPTPLCPIFRVTEVRVHAFRILCDWVAYRGAPVQWREGLLHVSVRRRPRYYSVASCPIWPVRQVSHIGEHLGGMAPVAPGSRAWYCLLVAKMTHREKDELIFGLAEMLERAEHDFFLAESRRFTAWTDGYLDGKACMLAFSEGRDHDDHNHSLPALLGGEAPPAPKKIERTCEGAPRCTCRNGIGCVTVPVELW